MSGTMQSTSNAITLKGSAAIVTEFFGYGINSVLYQRGIYPPDMFERAQKYGLTMLVTSDDSLKTYIRGVLDQLNTWLIEKTVQKVVIVLSSLATSETIERWQFDIECDKSFTETSAPANKSEKEIHGEIQGIIRQITASVTFLPVIDTQCAFEVLMYTDKDADVPMEWEESDARLVKNGSEVFPLRKFSTKIHTVHAAVAYREEE